MADLLTQKNTEGVNFQPTKLQVLPLGVRLEFLAVILVKFGN